MIVSNAISDREVDRETRTINLGVHGFACDTLSEMDEAARIVAAAVNDEADVDIMLFATMEPRGTG